MSNERRVFRTRLLSAIAEVRETVNNLATDDASDWHTNLRNTFVEVSKIESSILNEMNAEVIRRRRKREAKAKTDAMV